MGRARGKVDIIRKKYSKIVIMTKKFIINMGQKINPNSFRIGINRMWYSLWYSKGINYRDKLYNDIKIRDLIDKKLNFSNLGKIVISRLVNKTIINIHSYK